MFYFIEGKKEFVGNGIAVINCSGVGFRLLVSDRTVGKTAAERGDAVKLYTYLHVREDALCLYGFYSLEEQSSFKLLIGVSGVGPKAALSILSTLSPEKLAMCIIGNDAKTIATSPGVGVKTAHKIILELKDKITKDAVTTTGAKEYFSVPAPAGEGKAAEAGSALVVLGYAKADAMSVVAGLDTENLSEEELIKQALKHMSRR